MMATNWDGNDDEDIDGKKNQGENISENYINIVMYY